ncbi:adenylate/guanylate cyclase domain-containing protein [Magnetospirillum gryphiswaldense]|uniref:Adenylate cyclase n=1 Tax=Magnetospirillum gryphiswaldense TaxID=55518 RepID=A4TY95_9PROT|nr:adenylate/guanylate cyclase domain-containing protein [Magnetospirillum gryphiswaldense]AVM75197.1 Adenylate cyclase 1 [Magnetospirillum gryphiswaldense MSR-1]AVM79100.1 Adenylate cyclase 1 [Magnetospirillum gryphiswaldense]CAM75602.1 Adenylate cyclase [Magnetospirillum gryphiswaldense MSR-1]
MTEAAHISDQPYPIRRLFYRRVVPALVLSAMVLLGGGWVAVNSLERHVYLETTQRRVETTVDLAEQAEPQVWMRLLSGESPASVFADPASARAAAMLEAVAKDGHALQLKIFDRRGTTLYATDTADIGVREENALLRQVLTDNKPAIEIARRSAETLYEIYIPVETAGQRIAFEVYEPASVLDEIIADSFIQFAALPVAILLALGLWLARIVRSAQADIDARVSVQQSLRRQLERFVSQSAGAAARLSPDGSVPITRAGMTLFYSDVRDFSSLAEFHPPKATVDFLNELMTRQVEVVSRHGGDVDKMIGDALLVRFEGADREARALMAAQEILADLAAQPMARGIGIGIYDGEAILGAIGPKERQDFTVIGDSVNLAARLCSLAEDGQLVVDEMALRRSGLSDADYSVAEDNKVKGRSALVSVRRWSPKAT